MIDGAPIAEYGNRILYISLLSSIVLFLLIIDLVRKRRLSERFALAWLIIPALLILFSSNRNLLEWLAALAGVYYAPAIMIPIMFGLFIVVSLYFSVKVSRAEQAVKSISQELAILRNQFESVRSSIAESAEPTENEKQQPDPASTGALCKSDE